MSNGQENRKIKSLATIRNSQSVCPFCGSDFIWATIPCCFENEGKNRFIFRQVLYCTNCDLHFGTQKQIADFNKSAEKNNVGRIYAFPIFSMSAFQVKRKMYGTSITENEMQNEPATQAEKDIKKQNRIKTANKKSNTAFLYNDRHLDLFAKYKVPKSTIGIASSHELSSNKKMIFTLVDNSEDQNSNYGIFWTGRGISKSIIDAVARNEKVVEYNQQRYQIDWYTGPKLRDRIAAKSKGYEAFKGVENNEREFVDVQVYRNKLPCTEHPGKTELLTVYVFGLRQNTAHPIVVYYCPICEEYFVNYEVYLDFCAKYGIPPFRLYDDRNFFEDNRRIYDNLRSRSKLNLYGYDVNAKNGWSAVGRQQLLADLIDSGIMEQVSICSLLERIISLHKNNPKSIIAVRKWREDLEFVQRYKQNTERIIWGKFVPGKGKHFSPDGQ